MSSKALNSLGVQRTSESVGGKSKAPLRAMGVGATVLTFYSLLALLFTWPLAYYFHSHVPGDGIDDPALAWNLWWIKTRLVDQLNFDIFHVDWMFHPVQINLAFYTLTPLNGLVSIPLQSSITLIIANNLILLSSFVLGAYGMYLLTRDLIYNTHSQLATRNAQLGPLFAGLVYAFASSKLFYASLGQFNIASSQWIPFCVLYVLRIGGTATLRQRMRNALLAGLFLIFQAWAELTYASFLLIFITLYCAWLFLTEKSKIQNLKPKIAAISLLALIFILGISPFLWGMAPDLRRYGDFFGSGGGFADQYSADLMGYLLPTQLHPLLGDWVKPLPFSKDKAQHIFLGYSVMALALAGLLALLHHSVRPVRQLGWFWLTATGWFWWLTLGPWVRWGGHDLPLPGPFALISRLPFFSGNRYPSRYSVMLLLCVALLAGCGVEWLLEKIKRSRDQEIKRLSQDPPHSLYLPISQSPLSTTLFLIATTLFLSEHAAFPLPLNNFQVPAIYQKLAAIPGDFAVLELPTGWRNGARVLGKSDILIMMQEWWQTTHGKRRLGGNTSRNPPYKFQYFSEAPLLGDLIALMNAQADGTPANDELARLVNADLDAIIARNRPLADSVFDFLDVHFVLVHLEKSPPALLRFVEEALPVTLVEEWHGPDWTGAPSTIRLYQVKEAVKGAGEGMTWEAQLAEPASNLFLAEGWAVVGDPATKLRYATDATATLLLDLPADGSTLSLTVAGPVQPVQVTLNGQKLLATILAQPWQPQWVEVELPAGLATAAIDELTIHFYGKPEDSLGFCQLCRDAGSIQFNQPTALLVRSAGENVGNFAQIFVNGENRVQAQRGYNLVALDAAGLVLDSQVFDTHASGAAADAMARWLRQWPSGTIVAGAVMDEASRELNAAGVAALTAIGVPTDLRGKFRWSHAFISKVGAVSGAALEEAELLHPATVFVGAPVDAPTIYGGVGLVRWQAR